MSDRVKKAIYAILSNKTDKIRFLIMAKEQTLSIIKPDAVGKNCIGAVLAQLEKAGLTIVAMRMRHLTQKEAEGFYSVHTGKPFFAPLVSFMTSGPVLVMVLEGENAVQKNRDIMGATDPQKAAPGTIRKEFAKTIDDNVVHGSDSVENAKIEIAYFFSQVDICPRTR